MIPAPYNILPLAFEDETHWWFHCIWHTGDREASLSVDKPNGKFPLQFKCWACGKKGTAQDFAELTNQKSINFRNIEVKEEKRPNIDWDKRLYRQNEDIFAKLAKFIGVSPPTIEKFDVGLGNFRWQFFIPMYDEEGICGIQEHYWQNGKHYKKCQKYSKHGWFMPKNSFDDGKLFICEGFSDTAVLTELGFTAIGRFNALHTKHPPFYGWEFYIISDMDDQGVKGSKKLQKNFENSEYSRIIYPFGHKDIRDFYLQNGKESTRTWIEKQIS